MAEGLSWLVMPMKRVSFSFARLEKRFEDAAFGLNASQVVLAFERVDLKQIHLIHLQVLQTLFDDALNRGAVANADLGGDEEAPLSPARLEGLAVQLLAAAAGVAVGGVEVSNARLRGLDNEAHGVFVAASLVEALAAAAGQDGDALAGLSQLAHRQPGLGAGERSGNAGQGGRAFEELTSGSAHVHSLPGVSISPSASASTRHHRDVNGDENCTVRRV